VIASILSFSLLTSHFLAMGAPPQQDQDPVRGFLLMMGPIIGMVVIFYLVAIRPQQKQQKELKKTLDSIKAGDRVLTSGGIFGVVTQVREKNIVVKIAENTKVEMLRSGIQQVLPNESKEEKKGGN